MITITKSVGEGRKSEPKDVEAVQGVLRRVGLLPLIGPINDPGFHWAIRIFQKAAGITPDGRVDPGGGTLQKLNTIVEPLKILSIKPDKIANGGYKISIGPFLPAQPFKVLLGLSAVETDCVDITGRKQTDALDTERFDSLLAIIHRHKKWGTSIPVKVYVKMEATAISESAPVNLQSPVEPHNGTLLPLDEAGNGAKLKYLGDSATGPFYGRMLEHRKLGFYLFKYGGVIETDVNKRGFDCITYAGTVCGASTSHMAESGDLANSLGATVVEVEVHDTAAKPTPVPATFVGPPVPKMKKVKLESADPAHVKKFFESNRPERYLMWSGGHIVIVDNNTVHEFSYSKGGYTTTNVSTWLEPYKTKKLTVRKV